MANNPGNGAGTGAGAGNNPSCYNCHATISFIDDVSKLSDEFEMEALGFDIVAKVKSDIFVSKLRRSLLSVLLETNRNMVENSNCSITQDNSNLAAPETLSANENTSNVNSTARIDEDQIGYGNEQDMQYEEPNAQPKSKSSPRPKRLKMLEKRAKENDRVNKSIRVLRIETPESSLIFYECIICNRQFNNSGNARRHVKVLHLNLGARCPQSNCRRMFFNKIGLQLHVSKCTKTNKKATSTTFKNMEDLKLSEEDKNVVIVHMNKRSKPREKSTAKAKLTLLKPQEKKFWSRGLNKNIRIGDYTVGEAMKAKILLTPLRISNNTDPTVPDGKDLEENESQDVDPNPNETD